MHSVEGGHGAVAAAEALEEVFAEPVVAAAAGQLLPLTAAAAVVHEVLVLVGVGAVVPAAAQVVHGGRQIRG